MMILVADSGSTKTDWMAGDFQNRTSFRTCGFNPQTQTLDEIKSNLFNEFPDKLKNNSFQEIHFFGAGCNSDDSRNRMAHVINEIVKSDFIRIESDLLAAAMALFGKQSGIACILGTGSNSGFYDGRQISHKIPSLGYILGDEGSGAYTGRLLINKVMYGMLSEEVNHRFYSDFDLNLKMILDRVYKQPNPNVFLAEVGGFVSRNTLYPELRALLEESLSDFFTKQLLQYPEIKITETGFCGSFAAYNESMIQQLAIRYNIKLHKIIQSPVDDLFDYLLNLPSNSAV